MSKVNFIKSISYKNLTNWSIQYLTLSNNISLVYPAVKLSSLLKRNKTKINIQDNVEYKRIKIKMNNEGVVLRDIVQGNSIGTKEQYLVKAGQLILSKIDARNGAFGVIPEELDKGIITGNFWTFDIETSIINPNYLSFILATKQFKDIWESSSNGTTNRHYLQEDLFLNSEIPLPPLLEQEKMLVNYYKKVEEAEFMVNKSQKLEDEIKRYLEEILGIDSEHESSESKRFLIKSFSNLNKWGFEFLTAVNTKITSNFKMNIISSLCRVGSGGTPSRNRKDYYNGTIPWIKTGEVINSTIFDAEEKITEEAIKDSSAKIYPVGSLIIAMYGQGATRGRTAKLGIEAATNQACAVLYNFDNNKINTDFLWFYLMNEYERLRVLASGNNQPNLNAEMINNYPVITPPLEVQKEIVSYIKNIKSEVVKLRELSESLKKEAKMEFEEAIFY
ncbi:MAG: hsdS [Bacillales bacterium]|jgi:restriction endonuclease S subunit|nr:hsdS [Bacillales bacterium]